MFTDSVSYVTSNWTIESKNNYREIEIRENTENAIYGYSNLKLHLIAIFISAYKCA